MNFIFHSIETDASYENVTEKQFESFCSRLAELSYPKEKILITFDDGNKSDLLGFKIAKSYGLKTAHFIITERIGDEGYLCSNDLKFLFKNNAIIGSHTNSHKILIGDAQNIWIEEIEKSLNILEEILGYDVKHLSVPFGLYSLKILQFQASKLDLQIFTSDPLKISIKRGVIGRLGINSQNVDVNLHDLIVNHSSYRKAILFNIKNHMIKVFGNEAYIRVRNLMKISSF